MKEDSLGVRESHPTDGPIKASIKKGVFDTRALFPEWPDLTLVGRLGDLASRP